MAILEVFCLYFLFKKFEHLKRLNIYMYAINTSFSICPFNVENL